MSPPARGRLPAPVIALTASFLLPAFLFAADPVTRAVGVEGNSALTTREILSLLSTRPGRPFAEGILRGDLEALLEQYAARGYYDARIDSVRRRYAGDSAAIALTVFLSEGRRTVVGGIAVDGLSRFSPAEALALFDTQPGDPPDEAVLERDIDALLGRYERAGHPFAQCRIDSIDRTAGDDTDLLQIRLRLEEGPAMTIDEFRVEGTRETDVRVVLRETRIAPGERYDPGRVGAIRPRLLRLNIFADVSEPELYLRGEKGGLLLRVREGNTNTFDGVAGYLPGSSPGERGYVMGMISVSMRNLFGTGRKLAVRWQKEDRFSQELGLRYTEPWVLGYPVNLGGGFQQRKQDTSYVKRTVDLKGDLMLSDVLSIGMLFGSESVIPSDSVQGRVFRSSLLTVGAEILYDTRDDAFSPTSGARYRTDYQYGVRRLRDIPASAAGKVPARTITQRVGVDLDFYAATFPAQVAAAGVHGREVRSGSLDESEMFRFGGMRTLRGYRENQFLGSRIVWTNTEYRFLLSRRSFLYGFFDTGYYSRPADALGRPGKADEFKYGYGIGLQVETGLGVMGVSFALGKGDTFSSGKVHFGLVNEF